MSGRFRNENRARSTSVCRSMAGPAEQSWLPRAGWARQGGSAGDGSSRGGGAGLGSQPAQALPVRTGVTRVQGR